MDNRKLDLLTLDNFRIFADHTSFKFADLNIFTGANNSGKSTLIKAIKFFAKGLRTSDFPSLNLISEEINLGMYKDVINHHSNKQSFKIGFSTKIEGIDEEFNVIYTFSDGLNNDDNFKEFAVFSSLAIVNSSGELFFQIHSNHVGSDEKFEYYIESPSETGDPGIVDFRLNLDLLKRYLPGLTQHDFSNLLDNFENIKSEDNFWWGECFNEAEYMYANYDLSNFFLKDFERELFYDFYSNIAEYDFRYALYFHPDEDNTAIYQDLCDRLDYALFIKQVIRPILESITVGLEVFRNNNIIHVSPDFHPKRLLQIDHQNEFLQVFHRNPDDNIGFIREALSIFEIDGVVEVINHLNSAFEVNLISDVSMVFERNLPHVFSFEGQTLSIPHTERLDDYKDNPRINLADMGRGATNIIRLVLQTASILRSLKDQHSKDVRLPASQGRKPLNVIKRTILVEEPEAFLHPNWQSRLVDFFIYCMKKHDVRFIIETHSVYLIQRLQYLVAKQELTPEQINILYFNSESADDTYYKINVREDGILKESFGTGFYDETANLTASILNLKNLN